jgi:hypothetical protein
MTAVAPAIQIPCKLLFSPLQTIPLSPFLLLRNELFLRPTAMKSYLCHFNPILSKLNAPLRLADCSLASFSWSMTILAILVTEGVEGQVVDEQKEREIKRCSLQKMMSRYWLLDMVRMMKRSQKMAIFLSSLSQAPRNLKSHTYKSIHVQYSFCSGFGWAGFLLEAAQGQNGWVTRAQFWAPRFHC